MKESYRKGVATHPDPESCVAGGKTCHRSVDRGTGRPGIELRNICIRGADVVQQGGRQYRETRNRVRLENPAQSETPGMLGNSTRENREIPSTPMCAWAGQKRP